MASEHLTGAMVDVAEFPNLAVKHNVQSVPVVIVNDEHKLSGKLSEIDLVKEILKVTGK